MGTKIKQYFNNDLKKSLERQRKAQELIEENEDNTIEEISLLDAIIISSSGIFSPQKRISFLEDKLKKMFSWTPINPSDERGDYIDKNCYNFELKCSATNDSNTINILQVRPWQDVDYYRIIYFDLDDPLKSKSYVIPKDDMIDEIKIYGSATHGTKNANKDNKKIEYSFHLPVSNEWDDKYLDYEFFQVMKEKNASNINIFTPLF
jgi:hypothetical protein